MTRDELKLQVLDGKLAGEKIMVLEGVLNTETATVFRDAARENKPATLVVDMSRVRYMDSSGLGVIIGAYVTCERESRRLLLAGINDRVWEVFRICKVEGVFTRFATVADAEQSAPIPA